MPTREVLRVDLEQATDNQDGTINARGYPLAIYPRRQNQITTIVVESIQIAPASAIVEIWSTTARGGVTKYATYNGGILPRAIGTEGEPIKLTLYNLSRDVQATLDFVCVGYRINEPGAPL